MAMARVSSSRAFSKVRRASASPSWTPTTTKAVAAAASARIPVAIPPPRSPRTPSSSGGFKSSSPRTPSSGGKASSTRSSTGSVKPVSSPRTPTLTLTRSPDCFGLKSLFASPQSPKAGSPDSYGLKSLFASPCSPKAGLERHIFQPNKNNTKFNRHEKKSKRFNRVIQPKASGFYDTEAYGISLRFDYSNCKSKPYLVEAPLHQKKKSSAAAMLAALDKSEKHGTKLGKEGSIQADLDAPPIAVSTPSKSVVNVEKVASPKSSPKSSGRKDSQKKVLMRAHELERMHDMLSV